MNKKEIILSSGNLHKIDEIKKILSGLPFDIKSKNDIGLIDFDVEEDKDTLEGNALKKARELSKLCKGIVIADDTGLFVDKLGGQPGVYSARYAGSDATYEDNNKKLLVALEGTPLEERTAKFTTVIALVFEDESYKLVTGECSGKIGFSSKGSHGFGYDPLFIVDGYDKTFAELGEETKNKISHRARALQELRKELEKLIRNDQGEDSSR